MFPPVAMAFTIPEACGSQGRSVWVDSSTAARWFLVFTPTEVNPPPRKTLELEADTVSTPPLVSGAQDRSAPVVRSKAQALLRTKPPTWLNEPPTYRVVPIAETSFAVPFIVGPQEAVAPVVRSVCWKPIPAIYSEPPDKNRLV
jgi:hypothetical protein